jgi:archaellum component FlaC
VREQAQRTERLARLEHDILQEVHPEVGEIKDAVAQVTQDLADVRRDNITQAVIGEEVAEKITRAAEMVAAAPDARAS